MKYKWIEKASCNELSQKLGCEVKSIVRAEPSPEEEILERYIEIDLENETPEILSKIDLTLQGFKREGGRDLADVVADNLVLEYPNPQKEAYKLSQLYGLTHEQLDTYINNNVTNLAEAKEFVRKMAHVILWLVKQTKLDE